MTYRVRHVVYRPFSIVYFLILLFSTFFILLFLSFLVPILVKGLKIPPIIAIFIFFSSLMGSHINIPIFHIESKHPVVAFREIRIFGITWIVPSFDWGVRRTIVAVNLGGAIIPSIVSLYLLVYNIPVYEISPISTYIKILVALIAISYIINRITRVVPGFGIAVPGIIPPVVTSIVSVVLCFIPPISNPTVIAYISGTFGTLIGADLLNLDKIPRVGARIVSIGGAGTFDGIYLTGLIAAALTLIMT